MAHATLQKVVPALPVKNVMDTVNYYCKKLGFAHEWFYGEPPEEGGCRRDEIHVMFIQDDNASSNSISLLFFVHHIQKLFDELAQKDVTIARPLEEFENGLREFAITDCNGYNLRFAENNH